MEWNLTTIAILAGVLFFGYAFGLVEGNLKSKKKISALEAQAAEQERMAQEEKITPPQPVVSSPSLLKLWNVDHQLRVTLNDREIAPSDMSAENRKMMLQLINALRPWIDKNVTIPEPPSAPGESVQPVQHPARTEEDRAERVEPLPNPPTSILRQIDAFLQQRIKGTPLEEKGVSLREAPDGSVQVFYGLKIYNSIDDVPDPEAKSEIRAAINAWEKTSSSG